MRFFGISPRSQTQIQIQPPKFESVFNGTHATACYIQTEGLAEAVTPSPKGLRFKPRIPKPLAKGPKYPYGVYFPKP